MVSFRAQDLLTHSPGGFDWLYNYNHSLSVHSRGPTSFRTYHLPATTAGFGRHLWDTPIKTFSRSYFQVSHIVGRLRSGLYQHRRQLMPLFPQKIYAVQGIYSPLVLIVKISLFLLYYRIFSRIRRTRLLIYFGIGINAVFYAASFSLILYFCGPGPGHNLIQSFDDYHCVVQARTLATFQASFNIASDIYLLCIPMPVISNLQLSTKKKIGVIAMFMTGSLSVILPPKAF